MENVAHFVFIDQHKKTSRVGFGDSQGHHLRQFDIDHREKGISRLKRELAKLGGKVVVGLEATGFYDCRVELLRKDCGVEVRMGHPTAMKYITKAKNKTDGKDVERGLKLLGTDHFPEAYIPTAEERELRWLMTTRERVWTMQGEVRNSIRALLNRMNIELPQRVLESKENLEVLRTLKLAPIYRATLDELLEMLKSLAARQKKLDAIIEEQAKADPLAAW